MLYLMRSAGMLAALALSTASRSRGLALSSPPPARADTVISRMMRVQILPRFSSCRPLRCWILAHLLCPAMGNPSNNSLRYRLNCTFWDFYGLQPRQRHPDRPAQRRQIPGSKFSAPRQGQPPRPDHWGHRHWENHHPANPGRGLFSAWGTGLHGRCQRRSQWPVRSRRAGR